MVNNVQVTLFMMIHHTSGKESYTRWQIQGVGLNNEGSTGGMRLYGGEEGRAGTLAHG